MVDCSAIIPSSDRECSRSVHDSIHNSTTLQRSPNILILDGGVSTYLEHLLQKHHNSSRKQDRCGICAGTANNNNGNHDENDEGSFKYRSLWSSSLLLDSNGQNLIRKSHEAFLDAGCDIVSTVTYQLSHLICDSFIRRKKHDDAKKQLSPPPLPPGILEEEEDVDRLLALGLQLAYDQVELAKRRRCTKKKKMDSALGHYVIGSLGCYGAALADGSEYRGDYEIGLDELIQFHKRRFHVMMDWLADDDGDGNLVDVPPTKNQEFEFTGITPHKKTKQKIDGIAFETVPNVKEVEAIINVVRERIHQNIPRDRNMAIWISLACQNETLLNDGTALIDVLNKIEELDIDGFIHGIGVNCFDVRRATSFAEVLAEHQVKSNLNRAIILYPNSGEDWDADNEDWLEGSGCRDGDAFAEHIIGAVQLIQSIYVAVGKKYKIIVGGCCRTSPSTIQSMRQKIDKILYDE